MVPRPLTPGPMVPVVPQFYAGKNIFITGATGFMGKVLVERLLTTCPDIGQLHLLMRDKRGQGPLKRLAQLKQSQIFDNVRASNPRQLEKLVVVGGDVSKPQLGLDNEAVAALREVSVVFHSAATLKFDEPLAVAVEQNVRSVERVLELCDVLPNIAVFVHVSTAYSNAELTRVEERVYPPPRAVSQVYALVDSVPEDILAGFTTKYISPKPNTYTFTKSLAESVVQEHGNRGYPLAIFRPTVVVSSLRHPFPGWIENLNGPSGIVVGAGKGMLHIIIAKGSARADMLPVDIAIDTLIAAAWETAVDRPAQVKVYNCSTSENPITWTQFQSVLTREMHLHPLDDSFFYTYGYCVQNQFVYQVLQTVFETVPLHAAQYVCQALSIKTRLNLIKVNERLKAMIHVLKYFSTREWQFQTDNTRQLMERLSPEDRAIYNLDPHSIDWNDHIGSYVKGSRKYLLQEKDQDLENAKKHLRKMALVHYGIIMFVLTLIMRLTLQNRHIRELVYSSFRMLMSLMYATYGRITQSQ